MDALKLTYDISSIILGEPPVSSRWGWFTTTSSNKKVGTGDVSGMKH